MNTLICAGGSGIRVLEAVLHLCSAGLGPSSLRLLVVDPDAANGNGSRVTPLVQRYVEANRRFGAKLKDDVKLFSTELDLLDYAGGPEGLKTWSPIRRGQRLRDILNVDLLDATATPKDAVHLFFTEEELNMDLSQGFRGHPSIGAAALSLLDLRRDEQPWNLLSQRLRGDLGREEGARVFLAGSIFGGTGASTFFPLARFLRTIPEQNPKRLKIAVGAFSPYFRFESGAGTQTLAASQAARADRFPLATRGAVDFYELLRSEQSEGSWPFDTFFWLGDNNALTVPFAIGGPEQRNPAHAVELLQALAALDFFTDPAGVGGPCYAASRSEGTEEGSTAIGWKDIPLTRLSRDTVRRKILGFLLVGSVHVNFCSPLLRDPLLQQRPRRVPWYWERFASKEDSLATRENQDSLDLLDEFFKEQHFPWWSEVQAQDSVHLLNRAALSGKDSLLDRLSSLLWEQRSSPSDPRAMDSFYSVMTRVPKKKASASGAAGYLSLLGHAAEKYISERYDNAPGRD